MTDPLNSKELEDKIEALALENEQLKAQNYELRNVSDKKEELLNQAIDNSNVGIIMVQADHIVFANKLAFEILEAKKGDLKGSTLLDFIEERKRALLIQETVDLINNHKAGFEIEFNVLTKKGNQVPVNAKAVKILGDTKPVSILFSITKIHLAPNSKEFKSRLSKLETFKDFSTEGIFLLEKQADSGTNLLSWLIKDANAGALKLINNEEDFVKGNLLGNFINPADKIELPADLKVGFSDGFEVYLKNKSKHYLFEIACKSPNELICRVNDIDELVFVQNQLSKTLQRNELITEILGMFNVSDDYLMVFNKVLTQVAFHFKTRRIIILHTSEDGLREKLYTQWYKEAKGKLSDQFSIVYRNLPSWKKVLLEKNMILGLESINLPTDLNDFFQTYDIKKPYVFPLNRGNEMVGSIIYEKGEASDFDNSEINFLQMVSSILSNLTTRKFNEERLLKAKEKAEEADHLKSSFLANMSHDIRIPMTSIIGFSDLLADPDLTLGEREEFVELISKSGHDLLTLVDNIVDVAKIETGQLRITRSTCSIKSLLNDINKVHLKNDKVGTYDELDLQLDIPNEFEDIVLDTDTFRLKQIWNNLIDNAIKFTDKGRVKFGISNVYNDTIEFYVQDSGIGIAEETQHIIFERFSKINRTYTKEYTGTGLGLAICKSLVEMLGGEIRVISYINKGSTFYFTHPLPTKFEKKKELSIQDSLSTKYNWQGKTIVVVEDVHQNFKYLQYMLNPTKAEIVWIKDGQAAVDYFKMGKKADVVLMDIRLPVLDGLEATKRIKKRNQVPIIAQTAYTMGDEKELALQAGCVDYISKPIASDVLFPIIHALWSK